MELQGVVARQQQLLLLLCLSQQLLPMSSWPIVDEPSRNAALVGKLGKTFGLILFNTCVAHNMSVFLNSHYLQDLPQEQVNVAQDALFYVQQQLGVNIPVPMILDYQLLHKMCLHTQLVALFVQNVKQLKRAVSSTSEFTATHRHKYLVVLFHKKGMNAKSEMSQIFAFFLHERYSVDVSLLLVNVERSSVDSYTFWPYRPLRCGCTEPVASPLLKANLEDLFPPKLNNLFGCSLRLIVWNIAPFLEVLTDGDSNIKDIGGVDAVLLKTLAEQLNFTLDLVWNEPPHLVSGLSLPNGTMTGAYRMLQERRGNVTLGGAANLPARSKYLSSTLPYRHLEYVLILRRGSCFNAYEIMFCPFRQETWLLLLVMLCVLRLLYKLRYCFLMRLVLLGWIFLLYVLQISYESSVFKFVHNAPVRSLPQSLDQALEQDYTFITDEATYRMTKYLPEFSQRTRIVSNQPKEVLYHLLTLPENSRTAAFSSQFYLAYHLTKHYEHRQLFVIQPRRTVQNMICMYFPLNSYMVGVIDRQLQNIRSAGIEKNIVSYLKWEMLPKTKNYLKRIGTNRFEESMQFVYAAFNCLIFFEILALFVLFLELISLKYRWLKKCLQFL